MPEQKDYVPDGYVRIGHIARAHGIKGDVAVVFYSDEPERFGKGTRLRLGERDVTIERARPGKDGRIVTFAGVADRNAAEALQGAQLYLARADLRQLEDGEFWPDDLIGLEAVDQNGRRLGALTDVLLDSAQIRLVISGSEGDFEVPFVSALVPEVLIDEGRVVINSVEGLF